MTMRIRLSDHFTYRRLLRYTLPSVAMMIFTSIYSVVDGYFVSNFAGKTPFAAVNLVIPVLMMLSTVGFMFGAGGTAIVAKTFGEGNPEGANRYFSLFVYCAAAVGVVLAVVGIVFAAPISALLGAEGALLDDCVLYFRINLAAMPFFILQVLFQSFFSAAEKPKLGLLVIVISGCANMVLDGVLCTTLPMNLRLTGAACATAASQLLGGSIPLFYFARKNDSILRLGRTRVDWKILGKACLNGASEFLNNISMNLVGIAFNLQLMAYAGENGVAAYGVMMYVSMIFTGAFIGYSIGSSPLVSYHDGAANYPELRSLLRKSLLLVGSFGVGMVAAGELLSTALARLFVGYDAELMAMTESGFRIFALAFLFMGFGIFTSGFFTALNDGLTSGIIAVVRTMVFECGSVLLLPLLWGIEGIWYSVVVAEGLATVLSALLLYLRRKKYHLTKNIIELR